jgi:heme-degrading monooxygenase HmoA
MKGQVMFVLHVKMKIEAGQAAAAEEVFSGPFRAAITAQPGFRDVQFLRPSDDGDHVLSIAFDTQLSQQQWVGTAIHGKVWTQMEAHIDSYIVHTFNMV